MPAASAAAPSIAIHTPTVVLAHFDGDIEQRALIALVRGLRHDPTWRATLTASDRHCDVDLLYWPTGARYRIPLTIVAVGVSPVWRRA